MKKRLWHRCFPVNLKCSLMLLKKFLNDETKKNSAMIVLKSSMMELKKSCNDCTEKFKRFLNNAA